MNLPNKFFIRFFKEIPYIPFGAAVRSPEWVTERLEAELEISKWCEGRIGPEGFPFWQFSKNYVRTLDPSSTSVTEIMMADGIFIFKDEDRVAFKLTYGIADESYL